MNSLTRPAFLFATLALAACSPSPGDAPAPGPSGGDGEDAPSDGESPAPEPDDASVEPDVAAEPDPDPDAEPEPTPGVPSAWTCPVDYFGADDGCDCGCGAWDTDCATQTYGACEWSGCVPGENPDPDDPLACIAVDDDVTGTWTCDADSYGDGWICNCGCGLPDPDCDSPSTEQCYDELLGDVSCGAGQVMHPSVAHLCLPIEPMGGPFIDVAVGNAHSCALRDDHAVTCWGYDDSRLVAPAGVAFTSLSGGYAFTCGIREDQRVACWGLNDYDQLGGVPTEVQFATLEMGETIGCGVTLGGEIRCWGNDLYGTPELPGDDYVDVGVTRTDWCGLHQDGTVTCDKETPPDGLLLSSIACGDDHCCGLRQADSTIACFGDDGSEVLFPPSGTFDLVDVGEDFGCALRDDGEILCWGDPDEDHLSQPANMGPYIDLEINEDHTCAVNDALDVVCWGQNFFGQSRPTP